jgi:benzodiazapine receptor
MDYKKIFIILPFFFGFLIGQIIKPNKWYENLNKPYLNPPKILFPIVWTILYLLIGISYYLIIIKFESYYNFLFIIMIIHLLINYSFTILFFYLKLKLLSAIICFITLVLAIYLYFIFFNYDNIGTASYLLIPYIIWLIFANYLSWTIYFIN